MQRIGEQFKTADWKTEKHVPVIDCPDRVSAGEVFDVKVSIGQEVAHPNTTEHHIKRVQLYYKPADDSSTYEVGNYEFEAHGESVQGANSGPVYTHHSVISSLKINKPGTLYATSMCNIHGLWENSRELEIT